MLFLSVGMGPSRRIAGQPKSSPEVLTVFLTGNEFGSMKPCGCSGGQLGGFSRRKAILAQVPKARRLIIDTGFLIRDQREQDLIKFNVIIRALGLLDYDLVNLTARDIETAQNLGLLANMGQDPKFICAAGITDANLPATFSRRMVLKGGQIRVVIAAFDLERGKAEEIKGLFGAASDEQAVKILIVNGCQAEKVGTFLKDVGFVDCVVCVDGSDKPVVIGDAKRRPLVVSAGQLGKYVGKLEIRPGKGKEPFRLEFSALPVTEDLPPAKALDELYEDYQLMMRNSGILESQPRISLSDGLSYTGSDACKSCHEYAYEKWRQKGHARAYSILETVGSDYDPECVICHVVGLRYESGFVSPEQTPQMRDVGCENCHGPGSMHISSLGAKPTGEPKYTCEQCHTPDNSANYSGNEAEYFEKIIHWVEPNTPSDVKVYKSTGGSKDR